MMNLARANLDLCCNVEKFSTHKNILRCAFDIVSFHSSHILPNDSFVLLEPIKAGQYLDLYVSMFKVYISILGNVQRFKTFL
jgi:hypothetical protein